MFSPEWPLPDNVKALVTTRNAGVSRSIYSGFNLALHVGDNKADVLANRQILEEYVKAPIQWLDQVHSTDVVDIQTCSSNPIKADASYTCTPGVACAVMTADCLPVLLASTDGKEVAAVHAGWRGLANGIVADAVKHFSSNPDQILAFLGPAISCRHFQVGDDVLQAFQKAALNRSFAEDVALAFKADGDRFKADLYRIARSELLGLGVAQVYGGNFCTYDDSETYYSYRRDGQTGRMASLIWIQ